MKPLQAALPFVVLLTLLWLLLCPLVAMPLYNTMLFEPSGAGQLHPREIAGYPVKSFWIATPGAQRIFAWYIERPAARKTVLLSHGNSGDLSDRLELIERLVKAGASVLAYDYEGFGLSSGRPSLNSALSDGLAAYDFMVRRLSVPPSRIILFGESLGTGVSCQIAFRRPCDGVILQSAFTSLLGVAREQLSLMRLYPDALFPAQRLDSLGALASVHSRLLILHGARDPLVPLHHALTLYAAAAQPKQLVVLPDATHEQMPGTQLADQIKYQTALRAFIAS